MGQDGVNPEHQYLMMPFFRPTDCAAVGGPTISRVRGCISDEGWAAGRWRPAPPIVPDWLIARVESALQQAQR
jgi:hypothetical protein